VRTRARLSAERLKRDAWRRGFLREREESDGGNHDKSIK